MDRSGDSSFITDKASTRSIIESIDTISIDASLLISDRSRARVERVLSAFQHRKPKCLLLVHNAKDEEASAVASFRHNIGWGCIETLQCKDSNSEAKVILRAANSGRNPKTLAERVNCGKKILHLASRRSKFSKVYKPPKHIVCFKFQKLVLGTQCPYDCSYCFLQLTFRIQPYLRQYLNLEQLWPEFTRLAESAPKPVLLNLGELADPLALDPITGVLNEVIPQIHRYPNLQLLILTKSSNVAHLPPVNTSQVILAVSLSTPSNFQLFEHGTAHPLARINALKTAETKGYRTRARLDPIVPITPEWRSEYQELISTLLAETNVEMITLGQLRFYKPLLSLVSQRHPSDARYFTNLAIDQTSEGRRRADWHDRLELYRNIIQMIQQSAPNGAPRIMVCKEDPRVVKALHLNPAHKCNCLP